MHLALKTLVMAALLSSAVAPALADDWRATRLRGVVLELVDGDWRQLSRGDVVPDDRVVRTLRSGRVTLERGGERIDLGADTQVQIFDRSGRPFTTVKQYFGAVGIEANARNVEHFSVQTPHLSAVVKGTRFTVRSDRNGADVEVQRGRVAVRDADSRQSTLIGAGQSAQSGQGTPLQVSGAGELPVVYDAKGKPVRASATGNAEDTAAEAYAAVLAAGGSVKQAQKAAKAAEKAAEKSERAAEKAAKAADKAEGAAGQSANAATDGGGSGGNPGGGNPGNGNSGGSSGNGNSGNENSGGGSSGSGNSGNGNSGNGNSGNGNSGNGNSGNGN
jgi:hypothetical protein